MWMTLWQRQHKSSSWTFLKLLRQMAIYKIRSCTENNLVTKHLLGCWWASEGNKCTLEHIKSYLSGGWIRTGLLFRVMWKQKLKKSKTSLKAKKKKTNLLLRLALSDSAIPGTSRTEMKEFIICMIWFKVRTNTWKCLQVFLQNWFSF